MSRICKLDIACKYLARRQRTSSTSTRAREVGQGVTKKRSRVSDLVANRLSSYLHRSIANPATQKSTELNLGLKELTIDSFFVQIVAFFICSFQLWCSSSLFPLF